jgi:hypothetical protein
MENSLHRSLKDLYAQAGSLEVPFGDYRVDVAAANRVIEIQASPLGAIAPKVRQLVQQTDVLVVKPIVRQKVIVWVDRHGTPQSRRRSPKRGTWLDAFQELVHFTRAFPHPRLSIDLLAIDIEELRRPRARRRRLGPNYRVYDRRLIAVAATQRIERACDLWCLLGIRPAAPFSTAELAGQLGAPRWLAQKIAYTLRETGAARAVGKTGNSLIYTPVTLPEDLGESAA